MEERKTRYFQHQLRLIQESNEKISELEEQSLETVAAQFMAILKGVYSQQWIRGVQNQSLHTAKNCVGDNPGNQR